MFYEDDAWLSAEERLALDSMERLDSFSDLDDYDPSDREDVVGRWDDEEEEYEDDGFLESEAEDEPDEDW